MLEFEQARSLILKNASKLETEKVLTDDSVGRFLSENIFSGINMPPYNKSAMDGYALRARDLKSIPTRLKCVGLIQAGRVVRGKAFRIKAGECVKIMTGAPVPESCDTVVMVEDTRTRKGYVEILKAVKKSKNICLKGEDIRKGKKVLNRGRIISLQDIALLASVGRQFVKVVKKPRVAVLNTGGEIVAAGNRLGKGEVYNSNGPQLLSLLKSDGINADFLGIAKDKPAELMKAIRIGLEYDVFLISGGVSMGDYDLVPGTLKTLGVKEIFHKVRTKPGKPLFFGRTEKTIVFGIPGNPVSNFLVYQIYVHPALHKMMGRRMSEPGFEFGFAGKAYHQKTGRRHFVMSKISKDDKGRYLVTPMSGHGSADIMTMSRADGFMIVDADVPTVKAGARVQFLPLGA